MCDDMKSLNPTSQARQHSLAPREDPVVGGLISGSVCDWLDPLTIPGFTPVINYCNTRALSMLRRLCKVITRSWWLHKVGYKHTRIPHRQTEMEMIIRCQSSLNRPSRL